MTSFNLESQFLDVKKTYQLFEYKNLTGEGVVDGGDTIKEAYEGMTQNTYLFVQQKTTLTKDTENLSLYFTHKYCERNPNINLKAFENFPFEKVKDRVCFIFQKYQEQPTLLDSLLDQLIQPLMEAVKNYLALMMKQVEIKPTEQFHALLQIVYQLTKVRGDKWVIQHFPHEVKDLYPALGFLARERGDAVGNWQSRYVILLWLGVIALVPFDLDIIDSGSVSIQAEKGGQITEIVQLMIEIGKHYLKSLTKMRQASALFLSKLFTRPDIQKRGVLPAYIRYVLQKLSQYRDNPMQNFFVCGLYDSLHHIFKRVQRNELLPLITPVLQQLSKQRQSKSNSAKKQLIMKLLTRIGLTYLKPRVVTWAYRKKKQSLRSNLSSNKTVHIKTNVNVNVQVKSNKGEKKVGQSEDNQSQYYGDVIKENLEDIIDMLIQGLSEKQTSVREEAAKGLGTIAGRLSQDMVLDLVQYILNLTPTPQTQHSLCLTLAQLIRRNLLSPEKLKQLYPLITESLLYQKEEGGYSVGQAVRDAACYMTWSVARGYEQGGRELGVSLMIAACFDREVGCRRAASAAYQQLVGRVGDVPNGIEILTEADYFTLGPQKNAYLNVAIFVASYQDYYKPFVQHLCYQKLRHWDLQVKRIAACSLSLMACLNASFFAKQMLSSLANYLDADSQNVRLGAIIGLGEMLLGLRGYSHIHQMQNEMKDSVFLKSMTQNEKKLLRAGEYMQIFKNRYEKERFVNNLGFVEVQTLRKIIDNLKSKIKQGKIYKGKAGQNFRIYTCRLLECFALCGVKLQKSDITLFKQFIQQNVKNPQQPILFASVKCLKPFLREYHSLQDDKFIKNILHHAKQPLGFSKCYTLTVSKLTRQIYLHYFEDIINLLEHNCKISKQNNDPEKRKYSILAMEALVQQVGFDTDELHSGWIDRIFLTLSHTVEDYTMDKRGDIGSIVRQESMNAMLKIIKRYSQSPNPKWKISNEIITKVVGLFLQQLNEKIDRIRLLAGSHLQLFFDFYSHLFQIPNQEILQGIFQQQNIKKLVKQSQNKIDNNLQTQVIKMEMKIQETIFHEDQGRKLVYFWNLPHSVFPLTVPLLKLDSYSHYVLKGLCTSTGGISQSIIKYSLQELGNYITNIFHTGQEELLGKLLEEVIRLLKEHYKQERIIVPLYKTLDFLLEREEVIHWSGIKSYDTQLYYLIEKELNKTKSIMKVSAATGLFVSLLSLNNEETKKPIIKSIVKILCSDLPKARKVLADKFLLFLMSQDEYLIFNEEQSELLIGVLSENDFLQQKLEVGRIKEQIEGIIGQI